MRMPAANRTLTKPREAAVQSHGLHNGDHLDQPTFHALYSQTPEGFKAELVGGVVYVASPVSPYHGRPSGRVMYWLTDYAGETPGVLVYNDTTSILGEESEPQPDASMMILPECGGQARVTEKGIVGAPEFVAEVAYSTASIDLHRKRDDYERAGVREYLVVLPADGTVVGFTRGRAGFKPNDVGADGIWRSRVFPGLWLDPAGLFGESPRPLDAALKLGLADPKHAPFAAKLAAKRAKSKGKSS